MERVGLSYCFVVAEEEKGDVLVFLERGVGIVGDGL